MHLRNPLLEEALCEGLLRIETKNVRQVNELDRIVSKQIVGCAWSMEIVMIAE